MLNNGERDNVERLSNWTNIMYEKTLTERKETLANGNGEWKLHVQIKIRQTQRETYAFGEKMRLKKEKTIRILLAAV